MNTAGGTDNLGTIFSTRPDGSDFDVNHQFTYTNPGKIPYGDLVEFEGKLYGMTSLGGYYDAGVIFSWDPATGTYTKLHEFDGANGRYPRGSLTLYDGKLYGTTAQGGATQLGTVFSYEPVGNSFNLLMTFPGTEANDPEGSYPAGDLVFFDGMLYGTTTSGGATDQGVLFSIDPVSGAYVRLKDLNMADGFYPGKRLTVFEGKLYGIMSNGGTHNKGVLYSWDPGANSYAIHWNFNGSIVGNPYGSLTVLEGKLYGMAYTGMFGGPVVYSWDPGAQQFAEVLLIGPEGIGFPPYGTAGTPENHLFAYNGLLYGMTLKGGENDQGVIFSLDPATLTYTNLFDFGGANGTWPYGGLIHYGGELYGLVSGKFENYGLYGTTPYGVLFSLDPASGLFQKHVDFNYTEGGNPRGRMVEYQGLLYGMTNVAGQYGIGSGIFTLDPATDSLSVVKYLGGPLTYTPFSALTAYEDKIYGTIATLGAAPYSSYKLFSFDPVTLEFVNLHQLNGFGYYPPTGINGKLYGVSVGPGGLGYPGDVYAYDLATGIYNSIEIFEDPLNGASPDCGLVEYGGLLFGTASRGGANGMGVVYAIDPNTDTYIKLQDFESLDCYGPKGTMVELDGKLYGIAFTFNASDYKFLMALYGFDPATNTLTKLRTLSLEEGASPFGSLSAFQGRIYGHAGRGGTYDYGTIFAYDPVQDVFEVLHSFTEMEGRNGSGDLTLVNLHPVSTTVGTMIADIQALGLGQGLEQSLVVKLEHALESYDACLPEEAISRLQAFINQMEAQRGKAIPLANADALIADAQELIDFILANGNPACPPAAPRTQAEVGGSLQVYPNPSDGIVSIAYRMAEPGEVLLQLYDLQGRLLRTFTNTWQPAGDYGFSWDFSGVEAGVYILRLQKEEGVESRSVVRMRR